jgi:hypothetical protein
MKNAKTNVMPRKKPLTATKKKVTVAPSKTAQATKASTITVTISEVPGEGFSWTALNARKKNVAKAAQLAPSKGKAAGAAKSFFRTVNPELEVVLI